MLLIVYNVYRPPIFKSIGAFTMGAKYRRFRIWLHMRWGFHWWRFVGNEGGDSLYACRLCRATDRRKQLSEVPPPI